MHPDIKHTLAHVLLIELLAYQFASPVRWIETQDYILDHAQAQRVIEFGPSTTLTDMAKKTYASKFETQDTARGTHKQFLSVSKDEDKIYYREHGKPQDATDDNESKDLESGRIVRDPKVALTPSSRSTARVEIHLDDKVTTATAKPTQIPQAPVTALEIIKTILATKLKKTFADLPSSKSVKQIAGGRSALENEIVGDLIDEFGTLPERPEEKSLAELGGNIQDSFNGKLGKKSTQLLERMFQSIMPPRYSIVTAREHLNRRWGLGSGRQDSALVFALSMQPLARLPTTQDADGFFDSVVDCYAKEANLTCFETAAQPFGEQVTLTVDPHLLNGVIKGQKEMVSDILHVLAQHSDNLDLASSQQSLTHLERELNSVRNELELWEQEHGKTYGSGIRPLFSSTKVREYDSTWNWVMQDLYIVLNGILDEPDVWSGSDLERTFDPILRRSTQRVLDCIEYVISDRSRRYRDPVRYTQIELIGKKLTSLCLKSLNRSPKFVNSSLSVSSCRTMGIKGKILTNGAVPKPPVKPFATLEPQQTPGMASTLHIKRRNKQKWMTCKASTNLFHEALCCLQSSGISFSGRHALLIGAGRDSIGREILKGLLGGGASVLVTTSNLSPANTAYYQQMFCHYGARGSRLIVAPFNQGSKGDVASLVRYIFTDPTERGLGWDLDHVIPLAAISENGREIDLIDSTSELAHRIMLVNLLRLLGEIKIWKQATRRLNRPTQVLVPLSPNHGTFGHDGLYGESKLSLETLFNRWYSESWGVYLSITGTIIGWTRGTGLMRPNDKLAPLVEREAGIRTFSAQEMGLNMLALMCTGLVCLSQDEPILADFSGGLARVPDLRAIFERVQTAVHQGKETQRLLHEESLADNASIGTPDARPRVIVNPRPAPKLEFPKLPDYSVEIEPFCTLQGLLDLDRVVVVTGFGEIGPYGNARTRWDTEARGDFSPASYIEIAQMMGLIRFKNTTADEGGTCRSAWVDTKTCFPVDEGDIAAKYGDYINEHCGIRPIEPELVEGYDPKNKTILHEVVFERDLAPFEVSKSLASQYARKHGEKVQFTPVPNSTNFLVTFKKGAVIYIPKAVDFSRDIAGQIPIGWSATTYGIPEDIVNQVDRGTLYTLVSVAEALITSGITDPYEFYDHVHISDIGNCIGSGLGGGDALRKIYRDRFLDRDIPQDILQETFANTTAAWINMLLFSSTGPIRTPVGACATALESLDSGFDLIVSGKAQVCLVGGHDGFSEEISYEFGMMGATLNTVHDAQRGRTPKEMSRPATSSRDGFVEAHGAGAQILTSASLALRMGLPIYGVVAMTGTASDKIGRSVPAPGKGLVAFAKEALREFSPPMLDITFRRKRLETRLKQIDALRDDSLHELERHYEDQLDGHRPVHLTNGALAKMQLENGWLPNNRPHDRDPQLQAYVEQIDIEHRRLLKDARYTLGGNAFHHNDPRISPLRGALAAWNLSIDDLTFASFHGTSTKLNEKNESAVLQAQLGQLGRSKGNPIWGVFQKYLTGHPKGAAGAWMLNGGLQGMNDDLIPGNRNADNIDSALEQFDHIVYPNRNIPTKIKAFTVASFGFGQKGAQAVVVHPRYLYAVINEKQYDAYVQLRRKRERKAQRRFQEGLLNNTLVRIKNEAHTDRKKSWKRCWTRTDAFASKASMDSA